MGSFPIDTNGGPQVVLELIYRLKVRDVMTSAVVTAGPDASLRDVQATMRERGITGVPIVEGDRLVGMVSIGDVIEALDGGWVGDKAGDRMVRSLIVLEDEMPLSFAVTYFNRYGYGRFPVLNKDSALVGIVTAGDVIRALLIEMNREVERLEKGLAGSRDVSNDVAGLNLSFTTRRFDFESAGTASAALKKALREMAVNPETVRRASIASYELEMNQVIHSVGGVMEFHVAAGVIDIVARDEGPGIPDVEAALTEGFSTANEWVRSLGFGAGLGLPNAKRSSDEFSIESKVGAGTTVRARINFRSEP